MNLNRSSMAIFAFLLFVSAQPGHTQTQAAPSPIFTGSALPQPPRQNSAWVAPAGLPNTLISATRTLFEQGLADPRGGEYREISVAVGSPWSGDAGVMKTHGWVLPSDDGAAQKFAVCWNGLTYPIISLGKKADLHQDILGVISTEEAAQARQREQSPKTPYVHWMRDANSDAQTITAATFTPIKACLLLRLGETDLARRYWKAWDAGVGPNVVNGRPEKADPYLTLSSDWAWSLFDRALTAHMRGDDELSTISARLLTAAAPRIETEAARRGYVLPDTSYYVPPVKSAYLLFLEPLPRLLADGERRLREGKSIRPLDEIRKISNKKARIAALIENLDQITARQWGQPGGVSLSGDPIGRALAAEGDDAVQPLIDTLAGDKRLTRSVGFGRDFHRSRYTLSVAAAAYEVITDILQTTEFGPLPAGDAAASRAAAVQAYWDKYHALTLPQRWRLTLADDSAAPRQWLQAAKSIVTPSDVVMRGGWVETPQRPHNQPPPAAGESLRSETAPSISDLMARRVHDMIQAKEPSSSQQFYDVQNADQMALYLSEWDVKAAAPALKDQFAATRASSDHWRESMSIYQNSETLARITLARVRGGDTEALADYGAWIKSASLKDLSPFDNSPILEPLWRYPHDPATLDAAAYLFKDPKSLWVPLLQKREGFSGEVFENLLESPLLGVTPFRDAVLGILSDKSPAGTIDVGGPRPMNTRYIRSSDWPSKTTQISIRRCDMAAWRLSNVSGMPDFQYEWPEPKRNAAIAQAAERLRIYGDRYGHDDRLSIPGDNYDFPYLRARPLFPLRDHPASPQDVQKGTAIFALPEGARLVSMPDLPRKARWSADKRYSRESRYRDPRGKLRTMVQYDQDGYVWDAEETADGHRFYAFAGPHDFAQVPAEEIEFPSENEYWWTVLTHKIECSFTTPLPHAGANSISIGAEAPLTIHLRNRAGLAQTISAAAASSPGLPDGVTVLMEYSPYRWIDNGNDQKSGDFHPISGVHPIPALSSTRRTLEPAEECEMGSLDLSKFFDLSRPGTYRLHVQFDQSKCGLSGDTRPQSFVIGSPPPSESTPVVQGF